MAKLNFSGLKRPEVITETRTLTDASQPDFPGVVVTLQSVADYSEVLGIQSRMREFNDTYLDHPERDYYAVPIQVDGQDVPVTPELCNVIAVICALESPVDGTKKSTFEGWAQMNALLPLAFGDLVSWAYEIFAGANKGGTVGKNASVPLDSAATTDASSVTPQNITPPAIQNSSSETTPSISESSVVSA